MGAPYIQQIRTSYTGTLPTRLFPLSRIFSHNIPSRVNFNADSIISHIQEKKPDIVFIDCSNLPASNELLSQMVKMPINGSAFLGTTLIGKDNPLQRLYEIKANFSQFTMPSFTGNTPILSDILDVGTLEKLSHTNYSLGEESLLFSIKNAIELARGRKESLTDNLTGLLSEKAFKMMLNEGIAMSERNKENATVAFADLRRFKEINDTFGHLTGDQVIIRFAEIFKKHLRQSDIVSRPHGDEFLFLFHSTNEEGTKVIFNNILKEINSEKNAFSDIHPDIKPAINFGAISFNAGIPETQQTLLKFARQYYDESNKTSERDLIIQLLIDIADKLSYLSRINGENSYLIGEPKNIEKINQDFKEITKHGRER